MRLVLVVVLGEGDWGRWGWVNYRDWVGGEGKD